MPTSVRFLTVLLNFDHFGSVSIMHETTGSFSVGEKKNKNTHPRNPVLPPPSVTSLFSH